MDLSVCVHFFLYVGTGDPSEISILEFGVPSEVGEVVWVVYNDQVGESVRYSPVKVWQRRQEFESRVGGERSRR